MKRFMTILCTILLRTGVICPVIGNYATTTNVEAAHYVYYAPEPKGKWKLRKTIHTKVSFKYIIKLVAYAVGSFVSLCLKTNVHKTVGMIITKVLTD